MNAAMFRRGLRDSVAPVSRKLRALINRALLRRASYAGRQRVLQILGEGGQLLQNIEHLEPFGFTGHPLPGAEPIALSLNGDSSHTIAILVNDQRYRLVIAEGEAAIYNHHGDKVHIKADRSIEVKAATRVYADTPEVYCTGIVRAEDFITHSNVRLGEHDHDGVEPGSGTSGGPNPS